jgi:hypothetical protein|tara:strand:+ start:270 stop:593 length:324 start_codon:yes stop_codon:yes gene_type:complete
MEYKNLLDVLRSEYVHHVESETIISALEDILPRNQKMFAKLHWLEFILKFGSKGAEGFIGFIQWVRENEPDMLNYLPVGHDILGRDETCLLPKTSEYYKYYTYQVNA